MPREPAYADGWMHGKVRHPADLALASLRSLVLTRPSGPGATGGEGPPMPREPAYADERSQDGEAKSASE